MKERSELEQRLLNEARGAHGMDPEQLERTLHRLHGRLDFADDVGTAPRAVAAAAAVAAEVAIGTKASAAAALTTGKAVKLVLATLVIGGSVTTAVMVNEPPAPAPRAATVREAPLRPIPAPSSAPLPAVSSPEPPPAPEPPEVRRRPSEISLVRRAVLRVRDGDHAGALVLLDAHAERYPTGKFVTEREGLRVIALCGAGRTHEGLQAREAFLEEHAGVPISARVRRACREEDAR